uniref:Glutathione S-transferase kappa n=1 Tax=Phallusia mammillata TaxID=59560 RepID=A0A6F9DEP9_9ASCI|nr:glutathione S-transferase kappa 1-like [Phallusia mammillata]
MSQVGKKVAVELFYDVLSPYTYICFEILTHYNTKWDNMDLKLKPVSLRGIMGLTGNRPPGLVEAKSKYMTKDLIHVAKYYGIPFRFPMDVPNVMFTKGSLEAQRLLTVVQNKHPGHLESLSRALFHRIWVRDEDITTDDSLTAACQAVGLQDLETKEMLKLIKTNEVKDELKAHTQAACNAGAFGAPTYVVHLKDGPITLFGVDRFFLLCHYLNQEWPGNETVTNNSKM